MEIGFQLRQAREQRQLSLEDVSRVTKVPVAALDAIERGDVDRLAPSIFARGFVRAFAAEVGLNPPQVVDEYMAQFRPAPPILTIDPQPDDDPAGGRWSVVPAVALLSLGLAAGLYGAVSGARARFWRPAAQFHAVPTTGAVDRADFAASLVASLTEHMQLQIHARTTCAISATSDGEPVLSRVLQAGENVTVEGRGEIAVRVDNSGPCSYWIDGAPGAHVAHTANAVTIRMAEEREPGPVSTAGLVSGVAKLSRPTVARPQPVKSVAVPTPAVIVTDIPVPTDTAADAPAIDVPAPALEPTTSPDTVPLDPTEVRKP